MSSTPKPRPVSSRDRLYPMVAAALLAGVLLRLWFILKFSRLQGDSLVYGDFALNWLRHGVYGLTRTVRGLPAPPRPSLIRLPGYPLFLLLCFRIFGDDHYTAVLAVQAAIDLASCWLLSLLAGRLAGSRAALAALWLSCLCPFTAAYVATPLTETLTVFCIVLAFYALCRWRAEGTGVNRWLYVLALALAYSILLRPEQGMLAAVVVPTVVLLEHCSPGPKTWLRQLRPAAVLSVLTLLPLAPWTIRNERTFHVFQPLAPRNANDPGEANPYGFQRWYRTFGLDFATTETVYWNYDGAPILISDLPNRAFDSNAEYAETDALLADYDVRTTNTATLDARFNRLAIERIHDDPLRYYALLPAGRVLDMMFRPRAESLPLALDWWRFHDHPEASMIALALGLVNLVYFALAGLGFARRRAVFLNYAAGAPVLWAMVATVVLRTLLLLTVDNAETRYTLEFFPVLIVFGAAWLGRRAAVNAGSR